MSNEQLSIFDMDFKFKDKHKDKYGKEHKVPSWMPYERCENCTRWNMYQTEEQPPSGWGIWGWCTEHKEKTSSISYCQNMEDKNKI